MCIAVYIPKNKNVTDEIIKNCYENNPDGAGIMYQKDGKTFIEKGFFTVEQLIEAFRKVPTNLNRAIHCRIATSGKISAECCHPFPITKDMKAMGKAKQVADSAVIHNGVISFCSPNEGIKAPFSDTMLFTKEYLYPFGELIMGQAFKKLFEESNSSKLLIFKGNRVALIGKWVEEDGIYYSNTGYKAKWKSVYGYDWDSFYSYPITTRGNTRTKGSVHSKYTELDDICDLYFCCPKKEGVDIELEMIEIVDELTKQGCYPDEYTAWETLEEYQDNFWFSVPVMKPPTSSRVLGYEYHILQDIEE